MKIKNYNIQNNYITFGSIKQDKKLAEQVVKSTLNNFPHIKSNTYIYAKINKHLTNDRYNELITKLCSLAQKYNEQICENRKFLKITLNKYNKVSTEDFVNTIAQVMKKSPFGNCGEKNHILHQRFKAKNINSKLIDMRCNSFEDLKNIKHKNHTFVLLNAKKDAQIDDPSTWGNKAIIADAWCNIVMKAQDAIDYYREFLGIKPIKEFEKYYLNPLQ